VKRIWVGVTFRWSFPESAPAIVVDFGRRVVLGRVVLGSHHEGRSGKRRRIFPITGVLGDNNDD
jgi:hypothetical protein